MQNKVLTFPPAVFWSLLVSFVVIAIIQTGYEGLVEVKVQVSDVKGEIRVDGRSTPSSLPSAQ